jgi:hypothetical protein
MSYGASNPVELVLYPLTNKAATECPSMAHRSKFHPSPWFRPATSQDNVGIFPLLVITCNLHIFQHIYNIYILYIYIKMFLSILCIYICVCLWMCVFRYTMIQIPSHIPSIVISHIRSYHSLYIRILLFSYSLNIGIVIDIHMSLYTHFNILPNHLEQSCIYIYINI